MSDVTITNELTDAELDAVAGGVHLPYSNYDNFAQFAVEYWGTAGFVQTFKDFAWQVVN